MNAFAAVALLLAFTCGQSPPLDVYQDEDALKVCIEGSDEQCTYYELFNETEEGGELMRSYLWLGENDGYGQKIMLMLTHKVDDTWNLFGVWLVEQEPGSDVWVVHRVTDLDCFRNEHN